MSDANIPIDIHANKLLEWLISRRHCQKDYQKSLDAIRGKIREALIDMPQIEEVKELLQKNVFDYHVCLRIIDILKDTDKESKNFFGQYTSKRFQDWQEIIKAYEKDSLFLAEDAQNLIRAVSYDVPALKKLAQKLEQQISDAERSSENLRKQSKNYLNDYTRDSKKLGIEGVDIRAELAGQLGVLPDKLNNLNSKLQSLIPVCDYYKTFAFFITQTPVELLPTMNYLLNKGNTTYYEYRTGNVPDVIEEFKLASFVATSSDVEDAPTNEIDFGDDAGEIDFGDGEIDFGDGADGIDFGDKEAEISWDITEEATEVQIEVVPKPEVTKEQNPNDTVARGEDAQSVLLHSGFRNQFINELLEIEAFLAERLHELETDHVLASYLFQNAPAVLQMKSAENVREMLTEINSIRDQFETPALKVLYYMKDSPKYIDNVHRKLSHLKTLSKTVLSRAEDLDRKREVMLSELSKLGPQTAQQIRATRELQDMIENSISKKYNNRPVNIMGGAQIL